MNEVAVPILDDLDAAISIASQIQATDAAALAAHLYSRWYTNPPASTALTGLEAMPGDLVSMYRSVHAATYGWSAGWTVRRVSNRGRLVVERGEVERVVERIEVLPSQRRCLPPRIGDVVSVCARADTSSSDGQVWMCQSEGWDPRALPTDCARIYWNVPVVAACDLVRHLSSHLVDVDWALKVPATHEGFFRSDVAVLYMDAADVEIAAPTLIDVWEVLATRMRPSTPRFTKRLGRGWAAAHDPDTGESFGEFVSRAVAAAMVSAGACDRTGTVLGSIDPDYLLAHLAAHGIDPARPWHRSGSVADLGILVSDHARSTSGSAP